MTGRKLSEEHKKNIGLAGIGKPKSEETKKKMRKPKSEEAKKNMSLAQIGKKQSEDHKLNNSLAHIGYKQSKEHILNRSIASIKCNPNYEYCEVWHDKEYRKDLCKDYCENKDCKQISKRFVNHHIYLDKKRCAPNEIMTLCNGCHAWLHSILAWQTIANPQNFIIINRSNHVSYINKLTRKIIRIERVVK